MRTHDVSPRRLAAALLAASLAVGVLLLGAPPAGAAGPGSLDPTFGTGGKALTPGGVPSDATLLANGDIVVSGSFGLARFASNGALDQSFGASGFAATGFNEMGLGPSGLAIQPDGKIVWVGANTTQVTGGIITDFAVERFTANGTPDTSSAAAAW
jgi:uncharacterized delta-60 repeat protein